MTLVTCRSIIIWTVRVSFHLSNIHYLVVFAVFRNFWPALGIGIPIYFKINTCFCVFIHMKSHLRPIDQFGSQRIWSIEFSRIQSMYLAIGSSNWAENLFLMLSLFLPVFGNTPSLLLSLVDLTSPDALNAAAISFGNSKFVCLLDQAFSGRHSDQAANDVRSVIFRTIGCQQSVEHGITSDGSVVASKV